MPPRQRHHQDENAYYELLSLSLSYFFYFCPFINSFISATSCLSLSMVNLTSSNKPSSSLISFSVLSKTFFSCLRPEMMTLSPIKTETKSPVIRRMTIDKINETTGEKMTPKIPPKSSMASKVRHIPLQKSNVALPQANV